MRHRLGRAAQHHVQVAQAPGPGPTPCPHTLAQPLTTIPMLRTCSIDSIVLPSTMCRLRSFSMTSLPASKAVVSGEGFRAATVARAATTASSATAHTNIYSRGVVAHQDILEDQKGNKRPVLSTTLMSERPLLHIRAVLCKTKTAAQVNSISALHRQHERTPVAPLFARMCQRALASNASHPQQRMHRKPPTDQRFQQGCVHLLCSSPAAASRAALSAASAACLLRLYSASARAALSRRLSTKVRRL
jgi:hypothetical protein